MDQNPKDTMSVFAQLIELSAKPEFDWVGDMLSEYLTKKDQEYLDDLTEAEQEELIANITAQFGEKGQEVPDFIVNRSKGTADENEFVAETQIEAPPVPNANPNDDPANQVSKSEAEVEFDKKLSVLKDMLQNVDGRLAKYESLDIDELTELLDRYQNIGDADKLSSVINKLKAIKTELNITDIDDFEDVLEYLSDKLKSGTQTDDNLNPKLEGKEEMDQTKVDEIQAQCDDLKAKLARYEELGTPEELKEVLDRVDGTAEDNASLSEANAEMAEKLESASNELAIYQEIGTPSEINGLIDTHVEMRTKAESERIAEELGISAESVAKAITKFESVSEAEEFVRSMYVKSESAPEHRSTTRNKNESDESADFVRNGKPATDLIRNKSESAMDDHRKTTLRGLCDRL